MSDIVYAVHTRAGTYLLDDDGFCRWVLSRSGARSDDRCVGAQFVAALDLRSKGGLVGELRIGSCALFIRSENGRFILIRTKPIEHVEIRDGNSEAEDPYQADEHPTEPEPEPVVLPSHHAVAGVFNAPASAPEPVALPEPRVIVQAAQPYYDYPPPPPPPMPARVEPPPRVRTEPLPQQHPPEPRRGQTEPPPPPVPPALVTRPPLPIAPPRTPAAPRARASRRDEAQATQPLPSPGPLPPSGPIAAWPPMLDPPPPQAELLPLAPIRPEFPSAEELDETDLEEVGEDDQVYSMEVTLSLPLFRTDARGGHPFRK